MGTGDNALSIFSAMWPLLGALLGMAVAWGATRSTVADLRREVADLRAINASVVGIDKRLAVVEEQVHQLGMRHGELRDELEHVHDANKAAVSDVRREMSDLRRDVREPTRPG